MTDKILLKDILFNRENISRLSTTIHSVWPAFETKPFINKVTSRFPELELKARIAWIAECLKQHLPSDYRKAVKIILKSLPPENNPELSDNDFGDFIYAPYAEFVAQLGCCKRDLSFSLAALYELTKRFSVEDSIRSFINAFPKETMAALLIWSKDANYHVRRLASEGTRPKLPWSKKISTPIKSALPILNNLFYDKTRYVVRSVANHINDISKVEPKLAIDTIISWQNSGLQSESEMNYLSKHALRSLIKAGDPRALNVFGFSQKTPIKLLEFSVPRKVKMNTPLIFSLSLGANKRAPVVIDYILHFINQSGQLKGRKTFKLKTSEIKKDTPLTLSKTHPLRENMTTRKIFRGQHKIELQVNGKICAQAEFEVV